MFLLAAALSTVLTNGMRVVVLPNKLAPVATVVMEYGVGSNDDSMPGLAHATEHMMYRGTADVSAAQLADIADRMGAQYDAATENEFPFASDPKNVDRAQAAAVGAIKRMQSAPLADVELERAKAVLLAYRVLPLASYGGTAKNLVDDQEYGVTAKRSDVFWKQLQATTPQQVQAAMRTLLRPDHFLRVIVEPGS